MTWTGWAQIALVLGLIFLAAWPLGNYIARVLQGDALWSTRALGPLERGFYRLAGVDPAAGMGWQGYATGLLVLSAAHFLLLYGMLRLQAFMPFNPQGMEGLSPWLAFNTAISFVTNTNWQAYSGEITLAYGTQMIGLTVHNFLSAATGIAAAAAIARAFAAGGVDRFGNFWADLTRITFHVLIPMAVIFGFVLVALGVPQTLAGYADAETLEGAKQTIALARISHTV